MHDAKLRRLIASNQNVTLGLMGRKGSGKDTVGKVLQEIYGFHLTSFGAKIYEEVSKAFGISIEQLSARETKEIPLPELVLSRCTDEEFWKVAILQLREEQAGRAKAEGWMLTPANDYMLSPRKVLQLWGTEYRRKSDNYYWVREAALGLEKVNYTRVAFTDVREPHEAAFIKRRDNGIVVKIDRPNNPYADIGSAAHSSESFIDVMVYDTLILNDKNIADLRNTVRTKFGVK